MNNVSLIGRLTADPEGRKAGKKDVAYARFSLAINRGKNKDGDDMGADFPSIVCFGNLAEIALKYLEKGKQIGVVGRIQTGSYKNDEGKTVYTTDVIAEKIEFLGKADDK